MVVAPEMSKPILKVSVSDDESSSDDQASEGSENEEGMEIESSGEESGNSASGEDNSDDEDVVITNKGWGDSISKILSSTKPKNKKTLVLSRAKKYSATEKVEKEEKPAFEVIGETKEEKPLLKKEDPDTSEPAPKKKNNEKPSIRVKPNILEKDRERLLNKIATKGVVQLFNAVRNQQKTMEKEMDRSDLSEAKKEKILKKFDKRAFLDTLMGQTKSVVVDQETKAPKNEVKPEEEKPRWNALRDDFMMGAKMKDWDKESVDE
ncbi:RRP15-like protein [Cydia strobilella]|uniref:RRP15-like protein n=1 Tax=Cydia strobilella TaxID=1100964 RepID=UPI00300649E6